MSDMTESGKAIQTTPARTPPVQSAPAGNRRRGAGAAAAGTHRVARYLVIALFTVIAANMPVTAAGPTPEVQTETTVRQTLEEQAKKEFGEKWPIVEQLLDKKRNEALAEILAAQNKESRHVAEPARSPATQDTDNWPSIKLGAPKGTASDRRAERIAVLDSARARTGPQAALRELTADEIKAEAEREARVLTPEALESTAGVAPANRSARGNQSAFQLDTSADSASASVNIVIPMVRRNPGGNRVIDESLSIKTSAPIKKGTDYASFASLDGTSTGLSLGVDWLLSSARPFTSGDKLAAMCRSVGLADAECYVNSVNDRVRTPQYASLRSEWENVLREFGWARVYRFGANVTQNQYNYFTSLTTKQSDREQQWTAGASFGLTSPARSTYIGGGFDVGRKYQEAKDRIVCPLSTTDTFDCVLGKFSAPTRYYSRTVHLELRSDALGRPFSLRLDHDFASDKSSADLPIYLLRDKKSKFTGGLRLGWTSDDDFIAGIFVGKEFGIEPGK